ncbi:hypothetical protein D3C81_938260 [compost metagenome]
MLTTDCQRIAVRAPFGFQRQRGFKAAIHQSGLNAVYRAAIPAVAAEGRSFLIAKTQPGYLLQQPCDFRHHHVIHGR